MNTNVKMEEQNKKDRIKILITGIVSLILIICIVGYTYSYFVVKDTDNITITGTVASGELEIEVNQLAPTDEYQNKGLIPQLDGAIRNAVVGRNNLNCVDDNHNSVCKVYEVIVTNKSNMSAYLDGYIKLDAGNNPNLKWALIDYDVNSPQTKPELLTEKNSYSEVTMVENVKIGGSGSEEATQKYYVVVWISETEEKQYDTGVFTGEITFEPTKYTSYVLEKSNKVAGVTDPFLSTSIERNLIHSINFIDTDDIEFLMGDAIVEPLSGTDHNEGEIPYFDVSILKDSSVKLYYKNYIDENGNNLYDVMIGTDTGITLASSGYYLFSYLTNMESIVLANEDNTIGLDTSKVTTMEEMFRCCISLTTLDVSNFKTSNVTSMRVMFASNSIGDMALTEIIGLDELDTSMVIDMTGMFQRCTNLTSIDVSKFKTEKVTSMKLMFSACSNLTSIDVSNFKTEKVTTMRGMFQNCSGLTSINVRNFNTSSVTDMYNMFAATSGYDDMGLANIYGLDEFDTSKVTDMTSMFQNCPYLQELNLSNFDTSNVIYMTSMFSNCRGLTFINVSSFDTSNVTDMAGMFFNCNNLTSLDVSKFNTSNVTAMENMFNGCSKLTSLDVSNFSTFNVTNMTAMFNGCVDLEVLDITNFNVSNVTTMNFMFTNCSKLKTIYASSSFNGNNVLYSVNMFQNCTSLVGGSGTAFDASTVDKTYAKIDGGTSSPGYFTLKNA